MCTRWIKKLGILVGVRISSIEEIRVFNPELERYGDTGTHFLLLHTDTQITVPVLVTVVRSSSRYGAELLAIATEGLRGELIL